MDPERKDKRSAAQERLRGSFLAQVGPRLRELAVLSGDCTDESRDTVCAELERVAATAGALGLDGVARAAQDAATSAGDPAERLGPVAHQVRAARPTPRFAPIGIVGDATLLAEVARVRATTAEPLIAADTLDAIRDPLAITPWAALLVPVDDVAAAREIADGAPVLAWGEGKEWSARLRAVELGADGFAARDGVFDGLLDRVRCQAERPSHVPEVFVIAPEGPTRDQWVVAMLARGFAAVASAVPAEIGPALDVVCPDAIVIGQGLADVSAETLVRATRSHGLRGHVPVLVAADPADPEAIWGAGADDLLPADVPARDLADRLHRRHARSLAARRGRHPVSGLLDRPAALRALDDRLRHAQRTAEPASVGIVVLEGLEAARERWGKAAANAAQRIVADTLTEGLRRLDVIGQLGDDAFVAVLHACPEHQGRRRLGDLTRKIALKLHGDHRLREVQCGFGIADTEGGTEGVALRADADLRGGRKSGS